MTPFTAYLLGIFTGVLLVALAVNVCYNLQDERRGQRKRKGRR